MKNFYKKSRFNVKIYIVTTSKLYCSIYYKIIAFYVYCLWEEKKVEIFLYI